MTTLINLYAGPGTGKSTFAAGLFARMKTRGKSVELVTEYPKSWAWEGRRPNQYSQVHFLGEQCQRETILLSKVDYIITDSPLLLSAFYAWKYAPFLFEPIRDVVVRVRMMQASEGHKFHDIWLQRTKPYVSAGRFETESQARDVDRELLRFLRDEGLTLWGAPCQ